VSEVTALQAGNRLYAQKRYRDAIDLFLAHAAAVPGEAAKAYAGAAKSAQLADRASVERYYRAALAADPDHFLALRGLAVQLPEASSERCQLLERAAALRPDLLVLLALGDYYRSVVKDNARAYEVYARAQQSHPRDQTAYLKLNELCRRMGRPDEAKAWSTRWKASRPGA
jgi:tetratricopeptide (TPR) repeat protein